MPSFSVEVPPGSLSFVTEVPTIWPGYNTNTVIYVHPNGGVLSTSDTEAEIFFSGVNTDNILPYLEEDPMVVLSTTHNSVRVQLPQGTLGGPFRGTFGLGQDPAPQPAWADVLYLINFEDGSPRNHVTNTVWSSSGTSYGATDLPFGSNCMVANTSGTTTIWRSWEDSLYNWDNRTMTFECWVYWDSSYPSTADDFRRLDSWANTGGIETYGFGVLYSSSVMRTFVWTGSTYARTAHTFPKDQWCHLVYAHDAVNDVLYMGLNGVFVAHTSYNPTWNTSSAEHRITGSNGNGAFPGRIKEMRWSNGLHYGTGATYLAPYAPFPVGPY